MEAGSVYEVSSRATWLGQQIVSVFHLKVQDATTGTLVALAIAADAWKEIWRPQQVTGLVYVDWRALKVRGTGVTYNTTPPFRVSTVSFEGLHTGTLAGSVTGTTSPLQVACVTRWHTAESGRRRRGRTYTGGLGSAAVVGGEILAATRTALATNVATWLGVYGAGGGSTTFTHVVWSERTAQNTALSNAWPRVMTSQGAPDPADADREVISGVQDVPAFTQRRRVLGVGA